MDACKQYDYFYILDEVTCNKSYKLDRTDYLNYIRDDLDIIDTDYNFLAKSYRIINKINEKEIELKDICKLKNDKYYFNLISIGK